MSLAKHITETLRVILADPACRHDLIMAAIYLLGMLMALVRHRWMWTIYLTLFAACAASVLERVALP